MEKNCHSTFIEWQAFTRENIYPHVYVMESSREVK